MASDRLRKIDRSMEVYQEKMLAWEKVSDELTGRMACSLRLAECPA
jgi:hypothetical protein